MTRTQRLATVAVFLAVGWASLDAAPQQKPYIVKDARNTFVFDHLALQGQTDAPYVLEIADGDYFQVLVTHTDPRLFKYSVAATTDETGPVTATFEPDANGIQAEFDSWASVTQRHDKHFKRYRVTITAIGAQAAPTDAKKQAANAKLHIMGIAPRFEENGATVTPLLYPVAFDLWVETRPEWTVSFSGGVAFSNLVDHKYFIQTAADGTKTVEEDTASRDRARHDVIALANVYFDHQYFRGLMPGIAFGVGDSGGSTPRYFVGPSLVLGRNFIFTLGAAFGSVATLPTGQQLHQAPINGDNTLNALGSRYQGGLFASLAFTFVGKETEFKGAFSSTTATGTQSPPAGAGGGASKPTGFEGNYQTSDGRIENVAAGSGGSVILTIDADTVAKYSAELNKTSAITLQKKSDGVYVNGDDTLSFTSAGGSTKLELKHGSSTIVTATKSKSGL